MPALIRGICGGGGKSVTLEDCMNIAVTSKMDGIEISWTDPENILFNDKVTAEWKGTKLVRKTGSYPASEKDGVLVLDSKVRNAYSETPFKDTGLQPDTMYYYCLFPYTDKAVTKSDDNRFEAELSIFDPILRNNTWEIIDRASRKGIASDLWNIGDEIDITPSGTFNETVTLQIWDFNHFDKSDGSGKAGIVFGLKNLMSVKGKMNSEDTSFGGWSSSYMKNTVMQQIFNSMSEDLQSVIKLVNTQANNSPYGAQDSQDKVFLPGLVECGLSISSDEYNDGNQIQFPIFTDNTSRIKKLSNGVGNVEPWWLRSTFTTGAGSYYFTIVNTSGAWTREYASYDKGVCFCFNV